MKNSITIRHPWPQQQLELLQGITLTNPYCQRFAHSYVIGTVQAGRGILQYRLSKQELARGAFYVIEPGEVWGCQSEELTFSHLLVDPTLLQHIAIETLGTEKALPHFPASGICNSALSQLFANLSAGLIEPASQLKQQETLLTALAQLLLSQARDRAELEHVGGEHSAIRRVKAYLAEHYAGDVSLGTLASIANLSAFHLTRVFRQAVGLPPHAYQLQLRIAHARNLLAKGLSVSYVAHETGFFDQTHFTKQFKRHVGITPGTYRKTAKFY
ncbi:AraC family transcriptional regulator [Ktedonosporobacter rubrisoli]|uniref:AraC family transcriptional regulator n=1 Tax=Ktedonosporobacter rubrisoli TaxID=2509675 RepID=A0A4P6JIN6_KTERU|nr:AraC family transcriptional regulator [Ktedonosporobacter rubrisoli]QBD74934.1 AraC family transcriptional regulator [Ktedonosporobacter rubrisoli]